MTNQIEKEFFEAIKHKPKYTYNIISINWFGGVFTQLFTKDEFKKDAWRWTTKEYRNQRKVIKVNKHYPLIPPKIILKLDDIVFNQDYGLVIDDDMYCYFDNTTCDRQSFWGDTKIEALLKLCTKLAPEIKKEIKEIFR